MDGAFGMAAIFTGLGAGLARGSGSVIGAGGVLGSSATGRSGEGLSVNAATGNLVINRQDEFLSGPGLDVAVSRTYNSQAQANDGNGDRWRFGVQRRLQGWTGTANTAGATVNRVGEDGSVITYTYDVARGFYGATDGGGAHDKIVNVGHWIWTDGDTQTSETYDIGGTLVSATDASGNGISYTYHLHNSAWRLSRATTSTGEYQEYVWSGENVSQIVTGYLDAATNQNRTQVRTYYSYDGSNRLTQVTVDLSPEDNSTGDGVTYTVNYEYGANGLISAVRQKDGSRTDIAYDAAGRVATLTETVGDGTTRVTSLGYGVNVSSVTDPSGGVTKLWYDNRKQLIQIMHPPASVGGISAVTQFEYDANGNLLRTIETNSRNASTPNNLVDAALWGGGQAAYTGDNLVDDSGWPQDRDGSLPALGSSAGSWGVHSPPEAEWVSTSGPYGQQVVAMRTGQSDASDPGGGALSASFAVDKTKAYEFSIYVKADQLGLHRAYFGLGGGIVKEGHTGQRNDNPYFTYEYPTAGSGWAAGRWVKIVGYVLPGGSNLEQYGSLGGVYDAVTGQKLYGGFHYIWDSSQSTTSTYLRFFNYYNQATPGKFTYWNRPSVRQIDDAAVLRGTAPLDIVRDAALFRSPTVGTSHYAPAIERDDEARWTTVRGPDGSHSVGLQTGQFDNEAGGGGAYTNEFTIDGSKAYKFTQYFRKSDLTKHNIYFGLTGWVSTAFVKNAEGGWEDTNPYFLAWGAGTQQALLAEDRWYKVVAYVLPSGSANIAGGQLGGVYDAVTGAKVADVNNYRWSENRPSNSVHARLFTFYDELQHGWSVDWLAPEVVALDPSKVTTDSANPFGIVYDETGTITRFSHDANGNVTLVDRPLGSDVRRWYDAGNRLVLEESYGSNENYNSVSHYNAYAYDSAGRLRYKVVPDGKVTEYRYDGYGRVIEEVAYRGHTFPYSTVWIDEGTMNAWRDGLGDRTLRNITSHRYDGRGNLAYSYEWASTDSTGAYSSSHGYTLTYHTYDASGRLLAKYKTGEVGETFLYDGLDRVVGSSSAGSGVTTIFFDDAATRTVMHLSSGLTRTLTYNKAGDLISEVSSAPGANHTTSTDLNASWGYGGVVRDNSTSPTGATAYRYYSPNGDAWRGVSTGFTVSAGETVRMRMSVRSDGTTSTHSLGLYSSVDAWGSTGDGQAQAVIVSGPGVLRQAVGGLWYIDGISTTTETTVEIVRKYSQSASAGAYLYVGGHGSAPPGTGVILSSPSITIMRTDASTAISTETLNSYDKLGRLRVSLNNFDNGNRSYFVYDLAGRLVGELDDYGALTEYRYDASNRLIQTSRYAGAVNASAFAQLTDPNNAVTIDQLRPAAESRDIHSWTIYDANDRVVQTIDGTGAVTAFEYDGMGRVVRTTVYANRISISGWAASPPTAPVAVSANAALDAVTRTFYDRQGQVRGVLDGEGYLTENVYDAAGRLVETIGYAQQVPAVYRAAYSFGDLRANAAPASGENRRTRYIYDGTDRLRYVVDAQNRVTDYNYNAAGHNYLTIERVLPISVANWDFETVYNAVTSHGDERVSYSFTDATGRVVRTIDPVGLSTYFWYDQAGNVVKTQVGDGAGAQVTRNWYDARGGLRFSIDAENYLTRHSYSTGGRLIQTSRFDNAVSASDASTIQDINAQTTGGATYTSLQYDNVGRVVKEYNGNQEYTQYAYTRLGQVGEIYAGRTDATHVDQAISHFYYDAAGRNYSSYRSVGDAEQVTTYAYTDTRGNTVRTDDARGKVSHAEYDRRGMLVSTTDANGGLVRYQYNAFGEVIALTDARGHTTTSQYDTLGQLTRTVDAAGHATDYAYTRFGELLTVTRAGATTSFAYDRMGRVTRSTDALGGVESYSYDGWGNRTQVVGKLGGVTQYTYDKLGRMRYEWVDTAAYDNAGNVTANGFYKTILEYDSRGNVLRKVEGYPLPELRNTYYEYDRAGRLIKETAPAPHGYTAITQYRYDARGNLTSTVSPNGGRTVYYYDDLDRVTVEISPAGTFTTYAYDQNGNVTPHPGVRGGRERAGGWRLGGGAARSTRRELPRDGVRIRQSQSYGQQHGDGRAGPAFRRGELRLARRGPADPLRIRRQRQCHADDRPQRQPNLCLLRCAGPQVFAGG